MSGNDDAKDKYGFPLALVWPLQYDNNIVVSHKRSGKKKEHFTEVQEVFKYVLYRHYISFNIIQ